MPKKMKEFILKFGFLVYQEHEYSIEVANYNLPKGFEGYFRDSGIRACKEIRSVLNLKSKDPVNIPVFIDAINEDFNFFIRKDVVHFSPEDGWDSNYHQLEYYCRTLSSQIFTIAEKYSIGLKLLAKVAKIQSEIVSIHGNRPVLSSPQFPD